MLAFIRLAIGLVASMTSLLGISQVALLVEVTPLLTLPSYEHVQPYLPIVELGSLKSYFGLIDNDTVSRVVSSVSDRATDSGTQQQATPLFGHASHGAESVIISDNIPLASCSDIDNSYAPADSPETLLANTEFAQQDPSWENVGPASDGETTSPVRPLLAMLAFFGGPLDYVLFLVESPTSAMEALRFSVIAAIVLGSVFVVATAWYWCLPFVSCRVHPAPIAVHLLPNGNVVAIPTSQGEDNDALSLFSDSVHSVPKNLLSPTANSLHTEPFAMEMLALATDVAQARCDAVKRQLSFNIERANRLRKDLGHSHREDLNNSVKENKIQLVKVKQELDSTLQSSIESCNSEFDSKLDASPDSSVLSKLDNKLHRVTADGKAAAQEAVKAAIQQSENISAQALAKVKSSVSNSSQDTSISEILNDFKQMKSDFEKVKNEASKQRSENGTLVRRLEEKRKEYQAGLSKVMDEAGQRIATISADFKDALDKKADASTCRDLEQKLTNVDSSLQLKHSKLSTDLATMKNQLESKMHLIDTKIEKVQKEAGKQFVEHVEMLDKTKKLLSAKADSKSVKGLENSLSGYVKHRELEELSEKVEIVSDLLDSKVNISFVEEFRRELERKMAEVDGGVNEARQSLISKVDASKVDALTNRVSNSVDKAAFAGLKEHATTKLETLSDRLNAAKSQLGVLENQLSWKVSVEDFNALDDDVDAARSELKSVVAELDMKVTTEKFKELEMSIGKAQTRLDSQKGQLLEKVAMQDFHRLKDAMNEAQSNLRSFEERLCKKAEMFELEDLKKIINTAQSELTSLEAKLPVIQGMDFSKINHAVEFSSKQNENVRDVVSSKADERRAGELEVVVDSKAEKSPLAELKMSMDETISDLSADRKEPRSMAHGSQPSNTSETTALGLVLAQVNPDTKAEQALSNAPGESEEGKELEFSTMKTGTTSQVYDPVEPASPPADESVEESVPAIASSTAQQDPSGSSQSSTSATSLPPDRSLIVSEQPSKLHVPAVMINDEEAAKGSSALMASRWASQERKPLANVTNEPRQSISEGSKVVSAWRPAPASVLATMSKFHGPAMKTYPDAAARGKALLMESRYATPQQEPLANVTHLPHVVSSEGWKAVDTSLPTSTPADKQTSRFHVPSIKANPVAAAMGKVTLMEPRWAPPPPPSPPRNLTSTPHLSTPRVVPKTVGSSCSSLTSITGNNPSAGLRESRLAKPNPCLSTFPSNDILESERTATLQRKQAARSFDGIGMGREEIELSAPPTNSLRAIKNPNWAEAAPFSPPRTTTPTSAPMNSRWADEPPIPNGTKALKGGNAESSSRRYPIGNGPGPRGGQKYNTANVKARNSHQGRKWGLRKALAGYTDEEKADAAKHQDPATLTYAKGSSWEWLNPIVTHGVPHHQLRRPEGEVSPF
jgi:hypothetical protein